MLNALFALAITIPTTLLVIDIARNAHREGKERVQRRG